MKLLLSFAALNGFLAVLLGAFGAHALRGRLSALEDGARRLEWWNTATTYHLAHALALGLAALVVAQRGSSTATLAGWSFLGGIVLFSGSLYVMTLSGVRALGAVTPFGGLALLVGWALLFWSAVRL